MEQVAEGIAAWKGPLAGLWLMLVFVAERCLPAAPEPAEADGLGPGPGGGWARVGRNAALAAVNAALSPLVVLPLTYWASSHAIAWRPDWSSGWIGLLIDLVLLDLLIYWWHRANHRVSFLWRFHEVHHLDRFLDSTSALRFHFCEVLLSAGARAVLVIVLDIPFTSIVIFEVLLLLATVFHHSNLRLPETLERCLAGVIITPSLHWVHHHAAQVDTDSTYGTLLSIWDRLFGSSSRTRRTKDMVIGVEQRGEEALLGLVVRPFRLRNNP